ncbi:MAG: rhamnogalacturonan lyase [Prevotella sp.]|nr:rhamnogalacturonan lyase [Prevotella sp.]
MKNLLTTLLATLFIYNAGAQTSKTAQIENLDRGLVAVKSGTSTFLSWRLLATDTDATTFDVLRDGSVLSSGKNLTVTNLSVTGGTDQSLYQVVTKVGGEPVDTSKAVSRWGDIYRSLRLERPASQSGYHYFPNDCSVADLDGDGEYELIIKWDPSNNQDNSNSGKTGNVYLDAYKLADGEIVNGTVTNCKLLWRVDLGANIRAGAHYTQFLVYDFNGDGRAELICKTAPGSMDGQGQYVNQAADDATIKGHNNRLSYANSQGRVLSGAEYLTVFEGTTGRALHTIWYNPNRGFTTGEVKSLDNTINDLWGDNYGNRCDRFLACVAHLGGADQNASAVMCRGYYTRAYLWAVDFDGERLSTRWLHGSISPTEVEVTDASGQKTRRTYSTNTSGISSGTNDVHFYCTAYGQGCHSVSVGDVDGDGCDEIIYGSAAIDHDGQLLHTTGLGHGDALHLSDLMPDRPGLEVMMVHEEAPFGWSVRDAMTGELLIHHTGRDDTGRGIAADILADHRGFEYWHSDDNDYKNASGSTVTGNHNIYGSTDEVVAHYTSDYPFYNFRLYWDGDAQDDLFDKGAVNNGKWSRLLSTGDYGHSATYGSKANPLLIADIMGDWREEIVMFDKTDSCTINIFTTTTATKLRVPTLMHDHIYRMSVAWQNVGYNQPPHLGYYLPDLVATRFTAVGDSQKEQTVELGQPIAPITCRWHNCTSATLQYVYLDGTRIKSYAAPDGWTFERNTTDKTFTLSGTPAEAGLYEFLVKSSGDSNGTSITDTLRIRVVSSTGISEIVNSESVNGKSVNNNTVYDLQGRRIDGSTLNNQYSALKPGLYIVGGRVVAIKRE